jgi:hypothetical protein
MILKRCIEKIFTEEKNPTSNCTGKKTKKN